MDTASPDTLEQLRVENQRLRAHIAALTEPAACAAPPPMGVPQAAPHAAALAQLDALVTSAPIGIAYLDRDLRYVLVNPALTTLTGLPPEAHLGHTLAEVLPGLAPQLEPIMRQVLTTGETIDDLVRDGMPKSITASNDAWLINCFPVLGQAGEIDGVGVMITDRTPRTCAEAALRRSDAHVHLLAEHAHDVIYRYGLAPTFTLEYLSPAIERVSGYPRDAFVQDPELSLRLVHAEDLPVIQRLFTDVTSLPQPVIVRWWHQDGTLIWTEQHCWLVADAAGQPIAIEGIARDITARTQADAAVREREARYRTLFETMSQGVIYQDAAGQIIAANPAAERILGLTLDQLLGRSSRDSRWHAIHDDGSPFPGEDHPAMVALRTGHAIRDVVMGIFNPAADTYRWISILAVPQVWPGEATPAQVYIMFDDITERRQVAYTLKYERQQLDAILDTLNEGIIAFRPDGTVARINATGQNLTGIRVDSAPSALTVDDLTQKFISFDADGQGIPPDARAANRVLRGERFVGFEVCKRPIAQGADLWIAFSGTPVYDDHGTLILGVVTAQDITQRKYAEVAVQAHSEALSRTNAELTRALRLKDEFLAMMSHELRTPLAVVLGITESMDAEIYGPISARQHQALADVMERGRHLLAILSDILDLAHIEAGQTVIDRTPIAVDDLCRSVLQFVQTAAQQKGIRLRRSVEQGIVGMRADARRLTQILVNLLDNAVKFTPAGGSVGLDVVVGTAQDQIHFVVWDTGIGIAAADYARLFQPFTQVDGTLSRSYGGVGLGLTLVHRLVDLHGGSIALESTPGQGSRFTVSLPWADGENVAPIERHVAEPHLPAWTSPPRVVIADDHEPTLAMYRDLLTQEGCVVALARTGTEAVAQVQATHPDVAILDIQMPEMDGLTALRRMREDPAVAALPVIALTALAMPGDRERCLAAGATAYLAKPVGLRTLIATITRVLTPDSGGEEPIGG